MQSAGVITVSADGQMLEPVFIVKGGQKLKLDYFNGHDSMEGTFCGRPVRHGVRVTATEKGCQTGATFRSWLEVSSNVPTSYSFLSKVGHSLSLCPSTYLLVYLLVDFS
jgi:hypothetical protein